MQYIVHVYGNDAVVADGGADQKWNSFDPWERSGSVVERLTEGTAGLSLTDVTELYPWARHINP